MISEICLNDFELTLNKPLKNVVPMIPNSTFPPSKGNYKIGGAGNYHTKDDPWD